MDEKRFVQSAYAYIYLGLYDAALEAFARAILTNPDNPELYYRGSITARRNDRLRLADHWAKRAALIAPGNRFYAEHWQSVHASRMVAVARRAIVRGRKALATRLLAQAAVLDPLNPEASQLLATVGADERLVAKSYVLESEESNGDRTSNTRRHRWCDGTHG
ncbi:hypothetical protein Alches_08240 [Alicyclobacillus hesperidum subsp. aegles]|uniref:hypothetical protein n=1 Tax=Alicyclobacillus hesperidum TaxID=89784 RepID=UPI002228916C|nr:hypothetical protein [Alicyclobacillus hesperidum]GLG00785.1 hypothetical protein Alches_08240 [Alicyclobacillus hesperidum subsp. aegles]